MVALKRLFVAIDLTDEARHALAARLGDVVVPGRPVAPRRWHITLRFIGDVDDVLGDRVLTKLDEAHLGESFLLRWGGLGAFPRPSRATVLWIGLQRGESRTLEVAEKVESAVTAAGLPSADRPFRPHLTIARIRPQQDLRGLLESAPIMRVPMVVDQIALFRSHLGRGGPRYELLESFGLR